jgi:hypothetical protein
MPTLIRGGGNFGIFHHNNMLSGMRRGSYARLDAI